MVARLSSQLLKGTMRRCAPSPPCLCCCRRPALPVSMDELFGRMQTAQAGVSTMESRFEQVKRSSLLAGEAVSQGVMYYQKSDLIRWEYLAPDPYTIPHPGRRLQRLLPAVAQAQDRRVARLRHRVFNFLVATEPLAKLKTHFQVIARRGEPPTWTLVLTPLTQMIRKTIARVTVLVDKKTSLPAELLIEEADGDSTRIRFTSLTVNQALPDGIFRLQVPPGPSRNPTHRQPMSGPFTLLGLQRLHQGAPGAPADRPWDDRNPNFMPWDLWHPPRRAVAPSARSGRQVMLVNFLHLFFYPGPEALQRAGGSTASFPFRCRCWPIRGYQVFSLGSHRRVKEEGVSFQDPRSGRKEFLTPRK